MVPYEIEVAIQILDKLDNKCKDWYLQSLSCKDSNDKDICMAYYKKYDAERGVIITRLAKLTDEWTKNTIG